MTDYVLTQPVRAVQYELNENEQDLMELVRSTGRTGMSMGNQRGHFQIYNGGPELNVFDGDWMVAIGNELVVMTAERFNATFTPA